MDECNEHVLRVIQRQRIQGRKERFPAALGAFTIARQAKTNNQYNDMKMNRLHLSS